MRLKTLVLISGLILICSESTALSERNDTVTESTCKGKCVHIIMGLLCDAVDEHADCGEKFLRCCTGEVADRGPNVDRKAAEGIAEYGARGVPLQTLTPTEPSGNETNPVVDRPLKDLLPTSPSVLRPTATGPAQEQEESSEVQSSQIESPWEDTVDKEDDRPSCPGTCLFPLFGLLCDSTSSNYSCTAGRVCCMTAAGQHESQTSESPPTLTPRTPVVQSACDGRCIPMYLSNTCKRPDVIVIAKHTSCSSGMICCSRTKSSSGASLVQKVTSMLESSGGTEPLMPQESSTPALSTPSPLQHHRETGVIRESSKHVSLSSEDRPVLIPLQRPSSSGRPHHRPLSLRKPTTTPYLSGELEAERDHYTSGGVTVGSEYNLKDYVTRRPPADGGYSRVRFPSLQPPVIPTRPYHETPPLTQGTRKRRPYFGVPSGPHSSAAYSYEEKLVPTRTEQYYMQEESNFRPRNKTGAFPPRDWLAVRPTRPRPPWDQSPNSSTFTQNSYVKDPVGELESHEDREYPPPPPHPRGKLWPPRVRPYSWAPPSHEHRPLPPVFLDRNKPHWQHSPPGTSVEENRGTVWHFPAEKGNDNKGTIFSSPPSSSGWIPYSQRTNPLNEQKILDMYINHTEFQPVNKQKVSELHRNHSDFHPDHGTRNATPYRRNPNICGVRGLNSTKPLTGAAYAKAGDWCWHAAIVNKRNEYLCSGALIGAQWVLTTADCVSNTADATDGIYVRLGYTDISSPYNVKGAQTKTVAKTYIHHNYEKDTNRNDVALLKLRDIVDINDAVCMVCLPTKNSQSLQDPSDSNRGCVVTGYGTATPDDEEWAFGHSKLVEAPIALMEDEPCKEVVRNSNASDYTSENVFCAGYNDSDKVCSGGIGKSIVCPARQQYELVGISSINLGCGGPDALGMYVNVTFYAGWINQMTNVNRY